ncbi:carbohydrate kinase FGGY [Gracilibacillus halophilus YIM-C55.5]|uniref:Carbohydrate kinase FGGY n=1 Tax=Gracilibacillus halophilus YIM-C55.5 TaxID=1308866 RepID=N4WNN1_9BACI|nr:FGGY-family carbohydrate kinase [Gracilibacillus halophilus]ENH96065.1 carbohydrate kinase FGGY [Gracilibacillus halophilus YIM-C55.5]
MSHDVKQMIENGETVLGIELGSTRIKSVLIGANHEPIASGSHDWENSYVDNIWTYSLDDIWSGLQDSYQNLVADVKKQYDVKLQTIGAIGFSGMMHGYMAFNKDEELLVPFRTWRNNITEEASKALTELFNYNIPQRWSIAHLYQAILNKEDHVSEIDFQTTLAGYIHWQLTGEKVLGVGEASGVFPIDLETKSFNQNMINQFNEQVASRNFAWKLEDILPEVLVAGEDAGTLTAEGAKLLDVSGELQSGIPLCPPEGDAGTGMVATNSVAKRTGNVSAGTSAFAMVVLEKDLSKVYPEIDLVTTPTGNLVAMAHSNNCTSDLNAWVGLFGEFSKAIGADVDADTLFSTLFHQALKGDADGGGLLSYGYLSGEHMTHFEEGRPLFARSSESQFTLANFMRTHLFTAFGAMKIGMDILLKEENVKLDEVLGHGGIFKTEGVAQSLLAGAFDTPVSVMETAGEGGAWGIALLGAYLKHQKQGQTLEAYLNENVFGNQSVKTINPDPEDVQGFEQFMARYKKGLSIERAAVDNL